jgi:serine protease Do
MLHQRFHAARKAAGRAAGGLAAVAFLAVSSPAEAAAPPGGYADLVEQVSPAVVFIEVTAVAERPRTAARPGSPPFPPGGLEEFFERFGIPMPEGLRPPAPAPQEPDGRRGVGSGFLISGDGAIVTNHHVVAGATEILVRLDDGRDFEAELVGSDPQTDLALLRIETGDELPYVVFGDSAQVRPGDNVIAVGNPFGLGGTVTAGIVSAVARDIQAGPYDEFIQIDAAINRGNSGGPLFNEAGEVIGVNTAIFSPTGVNVGIGFAVPSNLASGVIVQLQEAGRVERGWLGVQLQQLTGDIAAALDLAEERGALVAAVQPDSPADEAGLEAGDVIVRYGGRTVAELRDLPRLVAGTRPGEEVDVVVVRGGEERTLSVTIAALEPEDADVAAAPGAPAEPAEADAPRLGIAVAPLDPETRALAGVPDDVDGVLVAGVDPHGPSAGQLRTGDVIRSVQGEDIDSPDALAEALEGAEDRSAVLLRVWRGGAERFVGIRPAAG